MMATMEVHLEQQMRRLREDLSIDWLCELDGMVRFFVNCSELYEAARASDDPMARIRHEIRRDMSRCADGLASAASGVGAWATEPLLHLHAMYEAPESTEYLVHSIAYQWTEGDGWFWELK